MAETKPATKRTKPAARTAGKASARLTAQERAALKEILHEQRAGKANDESAVLAQIAAMPEPDRSLAKRLHAIIKASAPSLLPKTWYGMPAYANTDGEVVCFFQDAAKFKARYAAFGFNDTANLDDGTMWPASGALTGLSDADEKRIAALVKRAVS
jgi:hypothetical protein